MTNTNHENQLRQFLLAYQAKDLDVIVGMLAKDVVLRDWNLEVQGIEAALSEFAKNFINATSLAIEIKQVYSSNSGAVAELEILVNGTEDLRVVDVIQFNKTGQISSIVSYKGL